MNVYETQPIALMDVTKKFNSEKKQSDLLRKIDDEKHSQIEKDSGVCELAREKYQESLGILGDNYSVSRRSSACSSGFSSVYSGMPNTTSPNTTASSAYSSAASSCYDTEARSRRKSDALPCLHVNSTNNNNTANGRVPPYHSDVPVVSSTYSVPLNAAASTKTRSSTCMSQSTRRRSRGVSTTSSKSDHSSEDNRRLYDSFNMTTYEKKRLLGKGGFARVYEVSQVEQRDHVVMKDTYAAKVIEKSRISRPQQREKVDIEVELLAAARGHPNVVNFIGSFEDENAVCILLELCNKKSLAQYLRKKQHLSEPEVSNIMLQIVSGLSHLHNQGIIHRDLKLGNILLTGDMQVKIGDFGLATRVEWGKKKTICGTPNFIAPEVLQRQGHGPEADIWALGCLLYTLLVGKPPFETACLRETYRCILKNSYRIPSTVSPDAADLLRWMLRHKPKSRPTLSEIASHAFFKKYAASISLNTTSELSSPVYKTTEKSVSEVEPRTIRSSDDQSLTPVRSNTEKSQISVTKSETSVENQKQETSSSTVSSLSPVKKFTTRLQKKLSKVPSPGKCVRVAAASFRDARKGDKQASPKGKPSDQKTDSDQSNAPSAHPTVVSGPQTWVSKWVDYSNRYGFGYQLSNGRICVLFNDGKHISMLPGENIIEYSYNQNSGAIRFSTDAVPPCLARCAAILKNFVVYMDKTVTSNNSSAPSKNGENARLLTWCRSDEHLVMYFSDGTLQVNFCRDHVKFNISSVHKKSAMRITIVDAKKNTVTYEGKKFAADASPDLKEKFAVIHSHFHSIFADVDCSSHPFCGVFMESGCSKCPAVNEEKIISSFPVQV